MKCKSCHKGNNPETPWAKEPFIAVRNRVQGTGCPDEARAVLDNIIASGSEKFVSPNYFWTVEMAKDILNRAA
jgi:hypothetical protein